jgi:hypothetical protein
MSDVAALLAQRRGLGAIFIPMGDRLRVRTPDFLPENLSGQGIHRTGR